MPDNLRCSLVTPDAQVLETEADYVSVPAWDGLLGVAPDRAPLLVKLGVGPLRLDLPTGESRFYFVAGGFAQVVDNQVTLLTEEAVAAEDLDKQALESELQAAQARIAHGDEQQQRKQRDVARARGMLRTRSLA